jgi:hypothetical protein
LAVLEGWISKGIAVEVSAVDEVDKVDEISSCEASGVH